MADNNTRLIAAVETGGTKILARVADESGAIVAEQQWATGSPDEVAASLLEFLRDRPLRAIGIAAFGPIDVHPSSADYGRMLATSKAGWTGSNLRRTLAEELGVPVAVDTDVNAAAIAEQAIGAGDRLPSIAYVTVGTGIGAGLAMDGETLRGALHPEAGHLPVHRRGDDHLESVCPFHPNCVEGLASGPAVRKRLGADRTLEDAPEVVELVTDYLAQLAACLVLTWSPNRIVWGGGVLSAMPLMEQIHRKLTVNLNWYGVGDSVLSPDFCARAKLQNAGLEGAMLLARRIGT